MPEIVSVTVYSAGAIDTLLAAKANLSDVNTALAAKADVVGSSDVEVTDATKGVILRSPDGSRWRITVGDDGSLNTTEIV
jgi:hypothetical protein